MRHNKPIIATSTELAFTIGKNAKLHFASSVEVAKKLCRSNRSLRFSCAVSAAHFFVWDHLRGCNAGHLYRILFGHREVDHFRAVEKQMEVLIFKLVEEKDYVDFLVGRNGEFDQIAASTVRRAKEYYRGKSSLIWVMPYEMAEYRKNKKAYDHYYDEVETCPESSDTYPKAAYQIRNHNMVERSDFVIFYVTHNSGGAYQTMQYAQRIGKRIINLAAKVS